MIPYARQSIDDADAAAVMEALRSDFLTQGELVPAFERELAQYAGAQHAVAVCNATSALHLAVRALGLGPGGLLWTSPNSFVASANCGRYCDAEVDFVDIDPRTYNLDPELLAAKLEEAGKRGRLPDIVVAVDFAGQPCDLDALSDLRTRYGFKLVEDASHAVGAAWNGRATGSGDADVTIFSFHPVKIITTAEGGMALTNDAAVASRMRLLRSHGITRERPEMRADAPEPWYYEQVDLGYNYRLTELQAALGRAQLRRIDEFLQRRRAIADRYDRELAGLPLVLPWQDPRAASSYHLYPIQVREDAPLSRRELFDALGASGIRANVHYIPIHTQPYYRDLGFGPSDFPRAEAYYARALSLPMYAALDDLGQSRVIAAIREALR